MPKETVEVGDQESSIGNWMKDLPAIDTEGTPAPESTKKEKPAVAAPKSDAAGVEKKASPDTTSTTSTTAESVKSAAENGKTTAEAAKGADDEDGEDKLPKTGVDWDKFKAKRKEREQKLQAEIKARETKLTEYDTKLKTLETELNTVREKATAGNPESQAEVERLKKELEDYSQRLAVTEVTSHPKFVSYFKEKVDEQISLAKQIVGTEMADKVEQALKLPDGEYKELRIEEIFADLSPMQQSRFTLRLENLQSIERERQSEIAKAGESRAKLQAEQKSSAERRTTEGKKLFVDVVKSMQDPKDGMVIYQLREGDEAWNTQVKDAITEAERLFFGHPDKKPADMIKATLNAAAFPVLLKSYEQNMRVRDEKISKLEAQVKELSAAQPSTGKVAAAEGGSETPPRINRSMSPMEASAAWLKGLQTSE